MPARPVLRPSSCVAPALLAWLAFAAPAPAQSSSDDHELVLACRGALWARTFDDATAAGLNPGAGAPDRACPRPPATRSTPVASPSKTRCSTTRCGGATGDSSGYRIELPRLATIASRGSLVDVSGKGQFKLDPRHEQPTPISFSCVYDADARAIATARFDVEAGAWTPSGEIASGRTGTLRCESLYDVQKQCPAAIKGSVTIVREFGRSKCEAYKNWIWSPSGITVWGGCRAEFEFEAK